MTYKFETYFSRAGGNPIVYSYDDKALTMTRAEGHATKTVRISAEQASELNRLSADSQMGAASVFAAAQGT
jgi:hypothetical protein